MASKKNDYEQDAKRQDKTKTKTMSSTIDLYWERHELKRIMEMLNLDEEESVALYQIMVDNDEEVKVVDDDDGGVTIEFDFTHIHPRTCVMLRKHFSDLRKKREESKPVASSSKKKR